MNIKSKIPKFEIFIEESKSGLKSATEKKREAAAQVNKGEDSVERNQMKYKFYADKEKYERKQIALQKKIKAQDDKEEKEALRKEVNSNTEEWKLKTKKFKGWLKTS